jgi:hypothetical protein
LWDYWYFFSNRTPKVEYRIGVVTYARFSYGKQNGYSNVVKNLSADFESLSNLLFKIPSTVEKGDQYVGSALKTCLNKISWSNDPAARKIIFLVGNGEVTLGPDVIEKVMLKLGDKNISVYPIYCKALGERKAILDWQNIAIKSGTSLATMSLRNYYFDSLDGFDVKKLRSLNRKLNNTYLYYGKDGKRLQKKLQEDDNQIYVTNTEGYRYRSLYKISDDYQGKNSSWDLVDLYNSDSVSAFNQEKKLMNDTCRTMSSENLKKYIILKKRERKELSSMIAEMIKEKEKSDMEKGINSNRNIQTLDVITLRTIKEILSEKSCDVK